MNNIESKPEGNNAPTVFSHHKPYVIGAIFGLTIAIILIILIILANVLVPIKSLGPTSQVITPTQTVSATPLPSIYADWNTYYDPTLDINFKLPKDWTVSANLNTNSCNFYNTTLNIFSLTKPNIPCMYYSNTNGIEMVSPDKDKLRLDFNYNIGHGGPCEGAGDCTTTTQTYPVTIMNKNYNIKGNIFSEGGTFTSLVGLEDPNASQVGISDYVPAGSKSSLKGFNVSTGYLDYAIEAKQYETLGNILSTINLGTADNAQTIFPYVSESKDAPFNFLPTANKWSDPVGDTFDWNTCTDMIGKVQGFKTETDSLVQLDSIFEKYGWKNDICNAAGGRGSQSAFYKENQIAIVLNSGYKTIVWYTTKSSLQLPLYPYTLFANVVSHDNNSNANVGFGNPMFSEFNITNSKCSLQKNKEKMYSVSGNDIKGTQSNFLQVDNILLKAGFKKDACTSKYLDSTYYTYTNPDHKIIILSGDTFITVWFN